MSYAAGRSLKPGAGGVGGGGAGTGGGMRLYPAAPRPLRATLAADVLALVLLAVFAVLAVQVHDGVNELAQIGQGVEEAGGSIRNAFETAANGVDGLPLVGGDLAGVLRSAGESTAGRAIAAGREGREGVHDLARLLGWTTFAIPAPPLPSSRP